MSKNHELFGFNFKKSVIDAATYSNIALELMRLSESYAKYLELLNETNQRYKGRFIHTKGEFYGDFFEPDFSRLVYKEQEKILFSQFEDDKYLKCEPLHTLVGGEEKIFLLPEKDKLLIIGSIDFLETSGTRGIVSALVEIKGSCKGRGCIYSDDDIYSDRDDIPAFAFYNTETIHNCKNQITNLYYQTEYFKKFEGVDIRDVLKPVSFGEIACLLRQTNEEETKKLLKKLQK